MQQNISFNIKIQFEDALTIQFQLNVLFFAEFIYVCEAFNAVITIKSLSN